MAKTNSTWASKLKVFVLMLALIVACAFVFSACGEKPQPKPGEAVKISTEVIKTQLKSLKNSTTNVSINYSGVGKRGQNVFLSPEGEIDAGTLKVNGSQIRYSSDFMELYADDSEMLAKDDRGWSRTISDNLSSKAEYDSIETMISTYFDAYEQLVEYVDALPYTAVATENGGKKATFTLDVGATYNEIVNVLLENKEKTIGAIFNELLSSIAGEPIDLQVSGVDFVTNLIQPTTTIRDIVDMASKNLGIDLSNYYDIINQIVSSLNVSTTDVRPDVNYFGAVEVGSKSTFDIETMLNVKIYDLFEISSEGEFEACVKHWLTHWFDSKNTLYNLTKTISIGGSVTGEDIWNALDNIVITSFEVKCSIVFNSKDSITNVVLAIENAKFEVKSGFSEEFCGKYEASVSVNFKISNIGKTNVTKPVVSDIVGSNITLFVDKSTLQDADYGYKKIQLNVDAIDSFTMSGRDEQSEVIIAKYDASTKYLEFAIGDYGSNGESIDVITVLGDDYYITINLV